MDNLLSIHGKLSITSFIYKQRKIALEKLFLVEMILKSLLNGGIKPVFKKDWQLQYEET